MKVIIFGIVQGVGFRPMVYRVARRLGSRGYVRNNGSNVEICIDTDPEVFISELKKNIPPLARIDRIESVDSDSHKKYNDFKIIRSHRGLRSSAIPADTAICEDCRRELFDPKDRRYHYPFINCTNCAARFSVIQDLPYDRDKTSMKIFKMCPICRSEYTDPDNRRYHAQTISCREDGPTFSIYDKDGRLLDTKDPIMDFAISVDSGKLGIIKGWGGMHIVCILPRIRRLRQWYDRPYKPFAVMVKDLNVAERYADLDQSARDNLTSAQKPIVLCKKRSVMDDEERRKALEDASPGLGNIGLYLPYSGIQHLLFKDLKHDAVVMTSANPKGEPLIIENQKAFDMGLDIYLLHNRSIVNRVDDSIVIHHGQNRYMIRKSRGFIPDPIKIGYDTSIITIGAERNVTSSMSREGNLYTSQYIGNINYTNTLEFLDRTTRYFMKLLGIEQVHAVGIDLHPQYPSRGFGSSLAEENGAQIIKVQHHWAHAVSLMLDRRINEPIIAISADGAGYGPDGTIWGGEVLYSEYNTYKRHGSLEDIPLIGGDAAVMDPRRLVFAVYDRLGIDEIGDRYFNETQAEIFRRILPKSPLSSSLGRVLDTISAYFGICESRTYDGEPAMRLEKYLYGDLRGFEFETEIQNLNRKIVATTPLFEQLYEYTKGRELSERDISDLVTSFVGCLIDNLVDVAVEAAEENGVKNIGFTGGVSYNLPITDMIRECIKRKSDLDFITHHRVPNGDGGISLGQNVIIGHLLKD